METAKRWWHGVRGVAPWYVIQAYLPGATLFILLLWLSHRFVTQGFGEVRQYAFARPTGGSSLTASMQRIWWSCTCSGACECLPAIARGLRRCCVKLLGVPFWRTLANEPIAWGGLRAAA